LIFSLHQDATHQASPQHQPDQENLGRIRQVPNGTGPTWGTRGIRGWNESNHPLAASVPQQVGPGILRVLAPNPGVMTGPGTNTYIITSSSEAAVVDPGPADARHLEAIASALGGRKCTAILLTHHHVDHVEGASRLGKLLGAPLAGYPSKLQVDIHLHDGSCLTVGGERDIVAVHTPGHASDHLCFLIYSSGIVLTGDHLMGGNTSVIAPPDGNMGQYVRSLQKLKDMNPRYALPGHGQPLPDPIEAIEWYVQHRMEREAAILGVLASQMNKCWTIQDIVEVVYKDVPPSAHKIAQYSVWAHLLKLEEEGRVRALGEEGLQSLWQLTQNPT